MVGVHSVTSNVQSVKGGTLGRTARANRLRPVVAEAVKRSSLREVAAEIGVAHTSLHNFIEKGYTPYDRTLDKIELWVRLRGTGAETGEEEGEAIAPNYEGLGIELPGYERLHDRPRREFDSFMMELIASGLGREDLEELGRGLLNPIAALNTLHKGREESDARSEEDQMLIMNGMIPVLRKIVRERWRR